MDYYLRLFMYYLSNIKLFLLVSGVTISIHTSQEFFCQRLPGMSVAQSPFENKNILLNVFAAGLDEDIQAFIKRYNQYSAEDDDSVHIKENVRSCVPQLLFLYAHYIALGGHLHTAQMNMSDSYFDIVSRAYGLKADRVIALKHILYEIDRKSVV